MSLRAKITPWMTSVLERGLLHMGKAWHWWRKTWALLPQGRGGGGFCEPVSGTWIVDETGRQLGSWWERWVPDVPPWAALRVSDIAPLTTPTPAVKALWNAHHDWKSPGMCEGMVSPVQMCSCYYDSREHSWRWPCKASGPLKTLICWILMISSVWVESGKSMELPAFLRLQMFGGILQNPHVPVGIFFVLLAVYGWADTPVPAFFQSRGANWSAVTNSKSHLKRPWIL